MTVKEALAAVDAFDWDSYNENIKGAFADVVGNIVDVSGRRGFDRASGDGAWRNDDPFVTRSLTAYVGDRIQQLDETTREDVVALIRRELEEGVGDVGALGDRIADLVQEKFDGYADWRADRIARTETGTAYNMGNVFGYRQAGVEHVEVSDGDDDEECAKADGQIWTLEHALAHPLAHPNCERDFSPVIDEEE